jgi:dUTPase
MIHDMREFFTMNSPMGTMDKFDRAFVKFNVINQGNEFVTFNKTKRIDPFIVIHEGKRDFTNEINILNQTAQMDLDSIEKLIERRRREEEEDEELAKEFGIDEFLERVTADNEVLTSE